MIENPGIEYADLGGKLMAYQRSGSGDPVLLIHGMTTYSFLWRNIMPILDTRFDIVAPDLIGCGHSEKRLDIDIGLKSQAAYIIELLNALDLKNIHLVGHDVGGGIAQILATAYPDYFRSLTLINSVGYDFWPVQPIIAMRTPIIRQIALATLDFGAFELIIRRGVFDKSKVDRNLMKYFWTPLGSSEGRKAFLHFAKCLDNQNLLEIGEDLKMLSLPTQIIRGEEDVYLSGRISENLNRDIPGSIMHTIEEAGHFIQEDCPEKVAELLLNFFNSGQ